MDHKDTTGFVMPEVVEEREVRYPSGTRGPRIGKVQVVRLDGVLTEVKFWYQWETGVLLRVQ